MKYIVIDKTTEEVRGTVNLNSVEEIEAMRIDNILIAMTPTYRNKLKHEIKYDNSTLRLATQQELDDYAQSLADDAAQKATDAASGRQKLKDLGLTDNEIDALIRS